MGARAAITTIVDPAFVGLIRRPPPLGTPLGSKQRKALPDAFSSTVDLIYPDEGGCSNGPTTRTPKDLAVERAVCGRSVTEVVVTAKW